MHDSNELCHCGKPLHYTEREVETLVRSFVDKLGRYINVTSPIDNRTYLVDRHYIALHGIHGATLHQQGFEETDNA